MAALSLTEPVAAGDIVEVQQQFGNYGSSAAGGESDVNGRNVLGAAVAAGQLDVVKWLLRTGWASTGDAGEIGHTAVTIAAGEGRLVVVQWLSHRAEGEPDENGRNVLGAAVAAGQLDVVKWLLRAKWASIGDAGENGHTALTVAAGEGRLDVVQWLLEEGGADVKEVDHDGNTALLHAAGNGHLAVVQWLLQKGGACIDEVDSNNDRALIKAADKGWSDVVQWLLMAGGESLSDELWFRLRYPTNVELMFADPKMELIMIQHLNKITNGNATWMPLHAREEERAMLLRDQQELRELLARVQVFPSLESIGRSLQLRIQEKQKRVVELVIWNNVDSTRRPSTLLLNMLLLGPPPRDMGILGSQRLHGGLTGWLNNVEWAMECTGCNAFLMNTCARAERLRARRPGWLVEKAVIVADSLERFPTSMVVLVEQYSSPSVEEIWSAQLGMSTDTDVATTTTVTITATTSTSTSTTTSTTSTTSTNVTTTTCTNTTTIATSPTNTTPTTNTTPATTTATTPSTTTAATTPTTTTVVIPAATTTTTTIAIIPTTATTATTATHTTAAALSRRNPDRVVRKRPRQAWEKQ